MKKRIGIVFIILLGIATFYLWQFILGSEQNIKPAVEVNFLNVGQGDSALIEMPGSNQIIIDGGPSRDIAEKVAKEISIFDRKIELVILTHPDKDHITGLFEVFDAFEVERVLMPNVLGEKRDKQLYVDFKKITKEEGSEVIFAKQGQKISFPGNVEFLVLSPKEKLQSSEVNDFSVVGKLTFGKTDFLFTGDISDKVEKSLLGQGVVEGSDVLKVSHHGSKAASSNVFLKEVRPEIAIISVGKNSYGHPTQETLKRLENQNIETIRTDQKGDIKITTDGFSLAVQ